MGDFVALAAQELLRPPSMDIDPELQAEIDAYLEENDVTMDEFFAQAAQNQLHPQIPGIGAKLKTEIEAYLEEHGMAMDEFIAMAAQDELHPKTPEVEVKDMGNLRTLAFQVPESLFQRVKQYLARNQMTQKAFVLGLIEEELDRDEDLLRKQQEETQEDEEEEQILAGRLPAGICSRDILPDAPSGANRLSCLSSVSVCISQLLYYSDHLIKQAAPGQSVIFCGQFNTYHPFLFPAPAFALV